MLRTLSTLVLATLLGCSSRVGAEEAPASTPVASEGPAIARIVTRDRNITLFAGHGAVRATVLDGSGRLIAHDVDIDALQNIDATANEACHASFADRSHPEAALFH